MTRPTSLLAVLFGLTPLCLEAAPTISPAGLQIVLAKHGDEFPSLAPFNQQNTGTTLALLIKPAEGQLIAIDGDRSSLETFTDASGKSLLTEKSAGFSQEGLSPFPRIADDGTAALVEIRGGAVPSAKSQTVRAKGTLALQSASKKSKHKTGALALKKGTKFTVADIGFEIDAVEKPEFGQMQLRIELKTSDPRVRDIVSAQFYTPSGEPVETEEGGSSSMTGFGFGSYTRGFQVRKAMREAILEIEIWDDVKTEPVPFDFTVGIGGTP